MDAHEPPTSFGQHLKISLSLKALEHAKVIFLTWNGQVRSVLRGNLQEQPGIRTPFIQLSGGVEQARAKTQRCRDPLCIADRMAGSLEHASVVIVHLHVSVDGKVVARANPVEMRLEPRFQPPRARRADRLGILWIRI